MGRLRLFVAVELSEPIKAGLIPFLQECSESFPSIKWFNSSQLHVTLRFLGDQEENSVPVIISALRAAGEKNKPFEMELGGFGGFSNLAKPVVLFVPVLSGNEPLNKLVADLSACLEKEGISFDEKNFRGHVTLGRVKTLKETGRVIDRLGEILPDRSGKMNVGQFVLFHSRLTEKGPIYTALETIRLAE